MIHAAARSGARIIDVSPTPPRRPMTPRAIDVALVGATAAVGLVGVFSEVHDSGRALLPPAFGGYLIALAAAGVLGWRRRAPLLVAGGVVAASLCYHLLGYPGLAPAAAVFVAVYTVTAHAAGRRLLLGAALIAAVGVIPVLPPDPAGFNLGALFGPPIAMIAAAAVGEAARARRVASDVHLRAVQQAAADQASRRLIEERLEIARELHDVLAHTITVIAVQAAAGADALPARPEETATALAAVRTATRDAMAELRATLVLLRAGTDRDPDLPPQAGLAQLPHLLEQATAAGVNAQITTTGDPDGLPATIELAVYRIVQEALTNTIRHSGAASATVAITFARDAVAVEVTDNGHPRDAPHPTEDQPATAAHGLTGMRERARALGGTLDAGPGPDAGFRVAARLPIPSST